MTMLNEPRLSVTEIEGCRGEIDIVNLTTLIFELLSDGLT